MYTQPPSHDITIDEFEQLAIGRLQLLRAIETAVIKGCKDDELARVVRDAQNTHLPLHSNESAVAYAIDKERRDDVTSHWLLRLAFAASQETIRWFVGNEVWLFKIRFWTTNVRERTEFLRSLNIPGEVLSLEEYTLVQDELEYSTLHAKGMIMDDIIKVPWTLVPDLISRRAVLLKAGFAYVPKADIFSIVQTMFRESLEAAMDRMSRECLGNVIDDRLSMLFAKIKSAPYEDSISSTTKCTLGGDLTAGDIERAVTHFPPCMLQLHRRLMQEQHLRYTGRQQLGLFMKSIGLPYHEAIVFWRRAFSKFSEETFNKEYAYNVRHNYGLEGKRANYGCWSCKQIMQGTAPGAKEWHGCPFKHADHASLGELLRNGYGLDEEQIGTVIGHCKVGQQQIACRTVLEMKLVRCGGGNNAHGGEPQPIFLPTQFYEASVGK